jgi:RecT family
METQITTPETAAFELAKQQAKALSSSTLVPKEFQGNPANCLIALNMAQRLKADPFMVMQSLDIIHGRPSFRAQFLIAMVNSSGRFTSLQFRMTGEGATRACVAHCQTIKGEAVEGPEISMAMAKAEGWLTKSGSKWQTMPELMLRYRAAAFFARLYAPDITLGMATTEELRDSNEREIQAAVVPPVKALFDKPKEPEETPRAQTPHEELDWLIRESGLTWEQVGPAAEAGGIILEAELPLNDQPEDVVAEILDSWDGLTDMMKGGAK